MAGTLDGKVALVTGGSRGIGRATARALAEQGATVAISYVANKAAADSVVAEIEAAGGVAAAYRADQADVAAVADLVAAVASRFGRLDILVNNAGVFEAGRVDEGQDGDRFARQMRINYDGAVAAIRAAARVIADGGRIVSISSVVAHRASLPGLADYGASKRALEGYSKGAARDLGARGITVNVLGVGSVVTDMNTGDGPTAQWERDATALGRFGRAEEIAAVVAFVASPAASFITGAIIPVDGGASA